MVRKLCKVLVACFRLVFWGLTLYKNLEKYKKWLNVLIAAERAERECHTKFEPSFLFHMDPMRIG